MMRLNFSHYALRGGRAIALLVVAVGLIGGAIYFTARELCPEETATVRMAPGPVVTRRFQIAQFLARECRDNGVDLQLVSTSSIKEALQQAAAGQIDMGFASAGLHGMGQENLSLLAGLDMEPLHILVRRELGDGRLSLCEAVRGRRVCLGAPGTLDRLVGNDVLSFLHLAAKDTTGQGDYFDVALSKDELCTLADQVQNSTGKDREAYVRKLPEVIMLVVTLPSNVAQKLFDTGEYSLMPFPYAEHYLTSQLDHGAGPSVGVDRLGMQAAAIPAAMYVGNSPIPTADCPTIGMRTLLVARADMSTKAVQRVMQSIFGSDFSSRIHTHSPRDIWTSLPIHPGAIAYLDRDKPLITGSFFESISKFLSIFGAFSAGALSLYGYLRRRHIRQPGEYLEQIRQIDAIAIGNHFDDEAPTSPEARSAYLQARLVKLKEQLMQDYCDKRVQGDSALMTILSMLSDSRSHLARPTIQPTSGEAATLQEAGTSRSPELAGNARAPGRRAA